MNVTLESLISVLSESENLSALRGIHRGIERECLRVQNDGRLSQSSHPQALGAALSHQHITTDYSESLLEFITPVSDSAQDCLRQLTDIHRYTVKNLGAELFWPSSMPCQVSGEDEIPLAQYGSSNIGRMKHTYRAGLKRRYGSTMQIISGLHYNVSLPQQLWETLYEIKGAEGDLQDFISESYMGVVRNFYRFGWLVPYLFGASPALDRSFLPEEKQQEFAALGKNTLYKPYATSLRMSDLGYTNSAQHHLVICHNTLDNYTTSLQQAIKTKAPEFADIGVKVDGTYRQLNDNVLQIENELYAPIRPKRVTRPNEKPSEALAARGIEYIEIRSLDVNPFSAVGITAEQMSVLDSFIVWLALQPSAGLSPEEMAICRDNTNRVVLEGRKPGLTLRLSGQETLLSTAAETILTEVNTVAKLLDKANGITSFSQAVTNKLAQLETPELLPSAKVLSQMQAHSLEHRELFLNLAQQYKAELLASDYEYWDENYFQQSSEQSIEKQRQIESTDTLNFDEFLNDYFSTDKKMEP